MPHISAPRSLRRAGMPGASLLTGAILVALFGAEFVQAEAPQTNPPQEKKFMHEVTGEFEVKIVPQDTGDDKMGMMTFEKQFHGDLNATGEGRMLTGMTDVKGSAAYVAIERVRGKLNGREGTFLMHHTGVMSKGTQSLVIRIVPDSGTGELAGIEGELHIKIAEGKHFYRLEYTLAGEK
jgi:Protein of unknown function (DUF3224)